MGNYGTLRIDFVVGTSDRFLNIKRLLQAIISRKSRTGPAAHVTKNGIATRFASRVQNEVHHFRISLPGRCACLIEFCGIGRGVLRGN